MLGVEVERALDRDLEQTALPASALNPDSIAQALGALMPEQAIVVNEAATTGTPALSALPVSPVAGEVAVTRTDSTVPTSSRFTRYVDAVAPSIGSPPRSHWNVVVTSAGSHVPGVAVSVRPSLAVPVTVGASTATGAA